MSLLASAFRTPLISHRNMPSSLISCLSNILDMHYFVSPPFLLRILLRLLCIARLPFLYHCFISLVSFPYKLRCCFNHWIQSHTPHNDVLVDDGPHTRKWLRKIIIYLPLRYICPQYSAQ
jgi:hypothetical protein